MKLISIEIETIRPNLLFFSDYQYQFAVSKLNAITHFNIVMYLIEDMILKK